MEAIQIVRATDVEYDELESCISSESEARLFRYGFQLCAFVDSERDHAPYSRQCSEAFQDYMLREFRKYCGNVDNKLYEFYTSMPQMLNSPPSANFTPVDLL
ncbi:hypothetical protein TELCIR_20247 [Teladorsagia circumcincta]|uniref:Uncharacterized protein n=1 Tax=Teladorsagia circumcincta TaxID=45464 RepID=A0A2G9TLV7_TELCI|nr:hypothetical protein TELCIR_20247 [Teladorsagia circumcincta]